MDDPFDEFFKHHEDGVEHIEHIPRIEQEVVASVPKHLAHRFCVMPLASLAGGKKLKVAMPSPLNIDHLDSLRYCLKAHLEAVIAPRAESQEVVVEHYGKYGTSDDTPPPR